MVFFANGRKNNEIKVVYRIAFTFVIPVSGN